MTCDVGLAQRHPSVPAPHAVLPHQPMNLKTLLPYIAVGFAALLVIGTPLGYITMTERVDTGYRGVHTSWGATTGENLAPGMNLVAPWQGAYHMNTRQQLYAMVEANGEGEMANKDDSLGVRAADDVLLDVDAAVRWQVRPNDAVMAFEKKGEFTQVQGEVRSAARSCIREIGAQEEWRELYKGERSQWQQNSQACIQQQVDDIGVDVVNVQIREVRPPSNIDRAIEDKEAAQERIEEKRAEVEQAKAEADRKVEEARGIQESNEIIAESLSEEYLRWYMIQEGMEKGDTVWVIGTDSTGTPTFTKEMDTNNSTASNDGS